MWYVYIYMCRTVITLECMEYYHASPYVVCIYIYVPYCHNPGVHGVLPRKPVCGMYIYIYVRTVITLECMEYYHASPYVVCIYIYMPYCHNPGVHGVLPRKPVCGMYIYIYVPYCHNPGVHGVLPRKPVCGMYIYIYICHCHNPGVHGVLPRKPVCGMYIYICAYCHNPGVHGVLPRKPVCGMYIYIYMCLTVITLECMEYYHASPYVVCIYIYICALLS